MEQRIITVLGGSGFLGRYVVKQLAKSGYIVRVICRHPDAALSLKTCGNVGQVVPMYGNITNPASLAGKFEDSYAIINLVGILFESGGQRFSKIHAKSVEKIAHMAKHAGIERFIQVSALGVDRAKKSAYARTKLRGEKAVLTVFPEATILRPSVIFGPEDDFFNRFASMAAIQPALPLLGGGYTKFQPVYVGDVAAAIETCLTRYDVQGQTYELAGPKVYSFREILEYVLRTTQQSRCLVPVPLAFASMIGLACELLPRPPLTRDQVNLLKYDNVLKGNHLTFENLGIHPTAVEIIAPTYLSRFHRKAA